MPSRKEKKHRMKRALLIAEGILDGLAWYRHAITPPQFLTSITGRQCDALATAVMVGGQESAQWFGSPNWPVINSLP